MSWFDPSSPYHLNQCLFVSDGVEHTPGRAEVALGSCGPVLAQMVIHADLKNTHLISTVTLYADLDRVDICNELHKAPTTEKQELDFVFPFHVPGRRYHVESPGAIIDPDSDYRPGSGRAFTAMRHFVDIANDEYGVTFSSLDSGLVEFGHRTTAEDPLETDRANSTLFAVALENCVDWHEAVRDQAGHSDFVFRYALRGHWGGLDATSAVQFGWEGNNDLEAVLLPGDQDGALPAASHSFVQVSPPNVVLTTVKVAEEKGLIARLWEVAGQESEAAISVAGMGSLVAAHRTDPLERDDTPVPVHAQRASVVRARARVGNGPPPTRSSGFSPRDANDTPLAAVRRPARLGAITSLGQT